jgi:hypothetical protein
MKSFNLVSEIRQASRGILDDSSKTMITKSSSSHDFDDIAAGCQGGGGGVTFKIIKKLTR